MTTSETTIWLQAARDAIDRMLETGVVNRVPELVDMTDIPSKARSLYEALDDVLSVLPTERRHAVSKPSAP